MTGEEGTRITSGQTEQESDRGSEMTGRFVDMTVTTENNAN